MANKAKQEAVLQALAKTLGVVAPACRQANVSRTQFYEWCKDPEFKAKVDEVYEEALDFVESKAFNLIQEGCVPMTIFYLKTKGKKRGYVESQEMMISEPMKKPSWYSQDE